jgi:excisionase family DNA binding protein
MDSTVSVTEAARRLGVSRKKVWRLISEGTLPTRPNPLDRRQKLIPVEALGPLTEQAHPRPLPSWVGMVSDPEFNSSESEEYMKRHWIEPAC